VLGNRAGTDLIWATGTSRTGETCRASARF
jgi:hypothetical protein